MKKIIALVFAFVMLYAGSAIGFTYDVEKLEGVNAQYTFNIDHISVDETYLKYASHRLLAETFLHELAHWTGQHSRANRQKNLGDDEGMFHEEVVAELTTLILSEVLNLKYAKANIEEVVRYLGSHPLTREISESEMKRATMEAHQASILLIGLFKGYGMLESGEPFDVVKVIFPEFAEINRGLAQ